MRVKQPSVLLVAAVVLVPPVNSSIRANRLQPPAAVHPSSVLVLEMVPWSVLPPVSAAWAMANTAIGNGGHRRLPRYCTLLLEATIDVPRPA